jgi:hypothetical protein
MGVTALGPGPERGEYVGASVDSTKNARVRRSETALL